MTGFVGLGGALEERDAMAMGQTEEGYLPRIQRLKLRHWNCLVAGDHFHFRESSRTPSHLTDRLRQQQYRLHSVVMFIHPVASPLLSVDVK